MTKNQKRACKAALRRYRDEREKNDPADLIWREAIDGALEYYASCPEVNGRGALLRMRYIDGMTEGETINALHIGRSTYATWQLDALATVGTYAAAAGVLPKG